MTRTDDELVALHTEIVASVSLSLEDEIDTVLAWLNPDFQPQTPTLRIKQCLKLVSEQSDSRSTYLIQQYYTTLIRSHFFSHFDSITQWKDMVKLEKLYISKVEFMYGVATSWIQEEMIGFKRMLMKRNLPFKNNLYDRLETLILNDELERLDQVYQWLTSAFNGEEIEFNVRMINLKVDQLSRALMVKKVDDRYLVMNTYNQFIKHFWSQFSKIIRTQDDHELTSIIYQTFENNFVKFKCDEFYTEIVPQFPKSRKCLLEFRSILNKNIKTVGTKVLETLYYEFVSRFLNSSLLTSEILYYYIKTVKSLKVIDPMGMCLRSLSKTVRKHLSTRPDVIKTILIGIFPFEKQEIVAIASSMQNNIIQLDKLEQLSHEIGDFSLGPETTNVLPWFNQPHLPRCTYDGNDFLLKQYLNWVPEPPKIKLDLEDSQTEEIKYVPPVDLIYVLLDTLESKRALVDDLLGVISTKFIETEEYTLDPQWQEILNILLNRLEVSRQGTVTSEEDDLSHLNDVDVMLRDLEQSCQFRDSMAHKDPRCPHVKILSKLYWRHYQPLKGKLITTGYEWDQRLLPLIKNLTSMYEKQNVGRTLRFDCGNSSRVSINMALDSGQTRTFNITMEQYLVIAQFQSRKQAAGTSQHPETDPAEQHFHSLSSLHTSTAIPTARLVLILEFWQRNNVIAKTATDLYHIIE